jgi:hypothetical protein
VRFGRESGVAVPFVETVGPGLQDVADRRMVANLFAVYLRAVLQCGLECLAEYRVEGLVEAVRWEDK